MLKILQARLQQYVNCEVPDVQAGFRKGRGIRDQIAKICWVIEKARKLEIPREHFMQRWTQYRTEVVWALQKQKILRTSGKNAQKNYKKRSS